MPNQGNIIFNYLREFLKKESAGGILLLIAAILALISANSPLQDLYGELLNIPVAVRIGALDISKPLVLWINDGLMAVFFLLIGLELKKELIEGELSSPRNIVLPAVAALGGMLIPGVIYAFINWNDPIALNGWAIPTATDIAFALGILSLFGKRVPPALKIFLVSLAIMDDMGAIIVIAIFYTSELSFSSLVIASACMVILAFINNQNIRKLTPYIFTGVILWVAVLKSGVHATLAGVILAFFIPLKTASENETSPLVYLEHDLRNSVVFIIMPLFAFFNAGVSLQGVSFGTLIEPVPLGIILGLFIGKQVGVFLFSYIAVKLKIAALPRNTSWKQIYGIAFICGVGFTMSLFIGSLAFEQGGTTANLMHARLGILFGSSLSVIFGYFYLNKVLPE